MIGEYGVVSTRWVSIRESPSILESLHEIERKLIEAEIKRAGGESYDKIVIAFDQLYEISDSSMDRETLRDWAVEWSQENLHPSRGMDYHLRLIHNMVVGTSSLGDCLLNKYLEMRSKINMPTQSDYFASINFCRFLDFVQLMGWIVYANAYKYSYKNDNAFPDIEKKYTEGKEKQTKCNKGIIAKANKWYQNNEVGDDCFEFDVDMFSGSNHFVDMHPFIAPEGMFISGVKFYRKRNRVALAARFTPIRDFLPYPTGPASNNWNKEDAFGQTEDIHYVNVKDNPFVHLEEIVLSPSHILTGLQFTKFHNRIAIKLQETKINEGKNGAYHMDEHSRKWVDPRDFNENNYYRIEGANRLINGHAAGLDPKSFITGAALIKFHDRLSIKLMTSFEQL